MWQRKGEQGEGEWMRLREREWGRGGESPVGGVHWLIYTGLYVFPLWVRPHFSNQIDTLTKPLKDTSDSVQGDFRPTHTGKLWTSPRAPTAWITSAHLPHTYLSHPTCLYRNDTSLRPVGCRRIPRTTWRGRGREKRKRRRTDPPASRDDRWRRDGRTVCPTVREATVPITTVPSWGIGARGTGTVTRKETKRCRR